MATRTTLVTCTTALAASAMAATVFGTAAPASAQVQQNLAPDAAIQVWARDGYGGRDDNHFGDVDWLAATTGNAPRSGFIRFDVSEIEKPIVESAEVTLYFTSTSGDVGDHELSIYGLAPGTTGENWLVGDRDTVDREAEHPELLTWANAPAIIPDGDGTALDWSQTYGNGTRLGTLQSDWNEASSGDAFSFSSDELADYLTAAAASESGLANLILISETTLPGNDTRVNWGGLNYEGASGSTPPELQMTLVPEPGSAAAMLGAAGMMLLARRRRVEA